MAEYLSIDFETRSPAKLNKVGVYKYAEDPYTEVMCAAYAFDDEPIQIWRMGEPWPAVIDYHVKAGKRIHAWNAMFERVIWRKVLSKLGAVVPKNSQFYCTMTRALACGLPAALENCAKALRQEERKDLDNSKAMKKLSRPRSILFTGEPVWWESDILFERMCVYCKQDVATEREAGTRIPYLKPSEQELYVFDQDMNDVGFKVDIDLCRKAMSTIRQAKIILTRRCESICGIRPSQTVALRNWLNQNDAPALPNLQREVVKKYLTTPGLPDHVKRILEIRFQAAKATSASKYQKALDCACEDGYLRGMSMFLGAAATGRWSSKLFQMQNLTRPKLPNMPATVQLVREANFHGLELITGAPMQALTDGIRASLIVEPDEILFSADLKNIESRVIAEQAGQESVLTAWRKFDRKQGPDLYVVEAAKLFDLRPEQIDDEKRFWGKQEVLSLGFEGGPSSLIGMVEKAGASIADLYPFLHRKADDRMRWIATKSWEDRGGRFDEKSWCAASYVVQTWRGNNQSIVKYWRTLSLASVSAVLHPGRTTKARKIRFLYEGDFLWVILPSGRRIAYAHPRVETKKTSWGEMRPTLFAHYVDGKKRWREFNPYGGHIAENVTQGDARDVMAYRLPALKRLGYRPLLTVHDEIVSKRRLGFGSLDGYIMHVAVAPPWAPDLPVAAEGWSGKHYRK